MAEHICPVCGCTVVDGGYQKEGVVYCCESCATGGPCQCGCGMVIEKEPETKGRGCRSKK